MFEWQWGDIRFRLSLLFPALITLLLLRQSDALALSCLLASLVHECGHLLAMLVLRVSPCSCTLDAFGMRLDLGNQIIDYKRNLLISLAGPLTNAMAAALFLTLDSPMVAMVHLVLAGVNLLPAAALDGGEILRCGLSLLEWEWAVVPVLRFSSALVLLPLAVVNLWLSFHGGNLTLLIVSGYLASLVFFSEKNEKNS